MDKVECIKHGSVSVVKNYKGLFLYKPLPEVQAKPEENTPMIRSSKLLPAGEGRM